MTNTCEDCKTSIENVCAIGSSPSPPSDPPQRSLTKSVGPVGTAGAVGVQTILLKKISATVGIFGGNVIGVTTGAAGGLKT